MEKSTDLKARVSVGASFSPFRFGPVTVTVRLLHTTVTATEGEGRRAGGRSVRVRRACDSKGAATCFAAASRTALRHLHNARNENGLHLRCKCTQLC